LSILSDKGWINNSSVIYYCQKCLPIFGLSADLTLYKTFFLTKLDKTDRIALIIDWYKNRCTFAVRKNGFQFYSTK